MKPDLELAGWAAWITAGLVAALKKALPAMKGWQTVVLAAPVAAGAGFLVQYAFDGHDPTQAAVLSAVAWPVSVGASWLIRMPQRPNGKPPNGG